MGFAIGGLAWASAAAIRPMRPSRVDQKLDGLLRVVGSSDATTRTTSTTKACH